MTSRIQEKAVSAVYDEDFIFFMNNEAFSAYSDTIERLAAYEDTGLSPEEITALVVDNKKLHKLVDAIQEVLGK